MRVNGKKIGRIAAVSQLQYSAVHFEAVKSHRTFEKILFAIALKIKQMTKNYKKLRKGKMNVCIPN